MFQECHCFRSIAKFTRCESHTVNFFLRFFFYNMYGCLCIHTPSFSLKGFNYTCNKCVCVCNYRLMNSKVIFTWHIGFRELYYENICGIAWASKGFEDIFNTSTIMKTSFTNSGSPSKHYKTLEMETIFLCIIACINLNLC